METGGLDRKRVAPVLYCLNRIRRSISILSRTTHLVPDIRYSSFLLSVFQTPWRNTLRLVMLVHAFITLLPYGIVSRTWWRREAWKVRPRRSSRTSKMPASNLDYLGGTAHPWQWAISFMNCAWFVIENNSKIFECNSENESFLETVASRKLFQKMFRITLKFWFETR